MSFARAPVRLCLTALLLSLTCSHTGAAGDRIGAPPPLVRSGLEGIDLRAITPPGYARVGPVSVLGPIRNPAKDTRIVLLQSTRKLPDGKREPRQLQIVLVAAENDEKAWEALRHPANAPFSLFPPRPGLLSGLPLEGEHVSHGVLSLPGTYTVAATRGGFGVAATHVVTGAAQSEPVPDNQIANVEAIVRLLVDWAPHHWRTAKRPLLRIARPYTSVRLRTAAGQPLPGLRIAEQEYVPAGTVAEAAGFKRRWDPLSETLRLRQGEREITLQLNSLEFTDGKVTAKLHRPVLWSQGQCWVSPEDSAMLFQQRVRLAALSSGAPGAAGGQGQADGREVKQTG